MNKIWLRTISVLEIIGGTFGILFILVGMITSGFVISHTVIVPVVLAIDALSLVAGIYLWKGTNFGRVASIIVQFIQLPKIASSSLIFAFSFGFDVFLHILFYQGVSNAGVQFRILVDNQFFINTNQGQSGVGLSLVSIIFLALLLTYSPEVENKNSVQIDTSPPSPDEYFGPSGEVVEKP